ncbi:hypothetical protein PHLGIDRAFT_25524 [Phlebiopsis gigantea 11061_1 CR5-6]|uniref:Peptidase S53 domain-containing protein n=1 Tax=Phlebiopsis gigantea (strain 11061_1 CR5-6) TaxID=745531 RepID=A0A0C3RUC7_PHLG1|nr:hypothetical protein PHLGIDRAFT_25524 [Phlebiopsis gigantea 11061_1 CR5-6]
MVSKFLVLSLLVSLVVAKPMARNMKLHESREHAPAGFVRSGAADADKELKLRIALVQNNPEGLIDALYAVSTPDSASYGEHLSKEEVEKFVVPSAATSEAVNAWLKESGLTVSATSPAGDWLTVSVPVNKANELFDADFAVYTHSDTGKQIVRTLSYSIPAELSGHLDFVHPTISFSNPYGTRPVVSTPFVKPAKRAIEPLATCSTTAVTPACVESIYGIPKTLATSTSNTLAVSGFIEQYANKADLKSFLTKYRTDLSSSTTFTLQTLDGGSNPQSGSEAGTEANLDIQYTVGIASGVPVTFISVGDDYQDGDLEGFLDIVNLLLGESNPPQVLTTSYGENESDISRALANNLCTAYAQLGARGTSILFASGDGGVSGSQSGSCTKFVPTFPSGCPYMTSVGATQLSSSSGAETAASFSSGGFSNYFGVPSYQSSVVSSYISSIGTTNSGKYNASGRAYPDVAAIGTNLEIVGFPENPPAVSPWEAG